MEEKIEAAIRTVKGRIVALTVYADMQKAAQALLNLTTAKAVYGNLSETSRELDEELTFVLGRVRANLDATALQQVTQAALHLMQAKAQEEPIQPAKRAKTS